MSFLQDELKSKHIPPLPTDRDEIRRLLCETEYGYLPETPVKVEWEAVGKPYTNFCAGDAVQQKYNITSTFSDGRTFTFPFLWIVPTAGEKHPAVVFLNFSNYVPSRLMPSEILCDEGYAVANIGYLDVTEDYDNITDGLYGFLYPDGVRPPHGAGKIMMWAWSAMRVMDFIQAQDDIMLDRVSVAGHSRLGKTALVAGAFDERFALAYSSGSGCCGASLTRERIGEPIHYIVNEVPLWFGPEYPAYDGRENEIPLDQHYLMALMAPRRLYVGSGELDEWADPHNEYLGTLAASEAWERLGLPGLVTEDDAYLEIKDTRVVARHGSPYVGYHLRRGGHYLTIQDWLTFSKFEHLVEKQ